MPLRKLRAAQSVVQIHNALSPYLYGFLFVYSLRDGGDFGSNFEPVRTNMTLLSAQGTRPRRSMHVETAWHLMPLKQGSNELLAQWQPTAGTFTATATARSHQQCAAVETNVQHE